MLAAIIKKIQLILETKKRIHLNMNLLKYV